MALGTRTALGSSLLGATLVAWVVAVQRMRGMDMGPGTDLGALGWFIGIWVTMMAAMMLPSAAPAVLVVGRLRGVAAGWVFVAGYLLAWTAFGLVAYGAYEGLHVLSWDAHGHSIAGAALAAAGLYQLAPLKESCLRHCRSPLHFMLRGRPAPFGTACMGVEHGAYCIGCCAGLMVVLFAVGVMSLVWMAVVAAVILVEKTLTWGEDFARVVAVAMLTASVWVALSA